jgi:hypothetical protein
MGVVLRPLAWLSDNSNDALVEEDGAGCSEDKTYYKAEAHVEGNAERLAQVQSVEM